MDLLLTPVGSASLALLVLMIFWANKRLPLGVLSLPGVLVVTSGTYFYLVPAIIYERGENTFLGWTLNTLENIHLASTLYVAGALVAFWFFRSSLRKQPMAVDDVPRVNWRWFWILTGMAVAGVFIQVSQGALNLFYSDDYVFRQDLGVAQFLNLSFSLMIPLTLTLLAYRGFDALSLVVLAIVLFVFLAVGFRFRIIIILAGTVCTFVIRNRARITLPVAIAGIAVALTLTNAIGVMRLYFRGLDFSALGGLSILDLMTYFGGEVGPVFTLSHLLTNPPGEPILLEPWLVGLASLVPRLLWPDKPFPEYLLFYQAGFPDPSALLAGVAATQHAELFLQFRWIGLPVGGFLYFCIACWSIRASHKLGAIGSTVGCAVVPTLFAFYIFQRGYFFQGLCEYLFTFAPVFLLFRRPKGWHVGARRRVGHMRSVRECGATWS